MSTNTLPKPKIYWSEHAKEDIEASGSWFEDFDRFLDGLDPDMLLPAVQAADTWYVIDDIDVTFPEDPAPGLGLDTWDF